MPQQQFAVGNLDAVAPLHLAERDLRLVDLPISAGATRPVPAFDPARTYREIRAKTARMNAYLNEQVGLSNVYASPVAANGHLYLCGIDKSVVVMKAGALHSDRWYPFGETTTNGEGVYHYRYRFDATTRTTTYRMEADVPRQEGFPWKAGHSRPALVQVRGRSGRSMR